MCKANIWSMKPLALLLAALAILALAPLAAAQVVVDIGAVENNASGTGWSTGNNFLTIHDGADIVITGTTNDRSVVVEENATVNITLDGVNIDEYDFEIRPDANVALTLSGVNTLERIIARRHTRGATLVINGSGSLEVSSRVVFSSGIDIMGNLTIDGGTITASGFSGIAIHSGNLTINRGTVTATGTPIGSVSPHTGIFVSLGNLAINGGAVTAAGDVGIVVFGGNFAVNGGTVTATGRCMSRSGDIIVRRVRPRQWFVF